MIVVATLFAAAGLWIAEANKDAKTDHGSDNQSQPGVELPSNPDPSSTASPKVRCWNSVLAESLSECSEPLGVLAFKNAFPALSDLTPNLAGQDLEVCASACADVFSNQLDCEFQLEPGPGPGWSGSVGWLSAYCDKPRLRVGGLTPTSLGLFVGNGDQVQHRLVANTKAHSQEMGFAYEFRELSVAGEPAGTTWITENGSGCEGIVRYTRADMPLIDLDFYLDSPLRNCKRFVDSLQATPPSELAVWQRG